MSGDVQVVRRGTDVLMSLTDGPKSLTEIVRDTGLAKGTAFRILASLAYGDLVTKDPVTRTYMLGSGFLRLVQVAVDSVSPLVATARPLLVELRDRTEETVTVHIRMGVERVCVDVVPTGNAVGYTVAVGEKAPLHVGAAGKVLLAFAPEESRSRLLEALPLERVTERTVADVATLERQLEEVREQGYALSAGERVADASAISVPLRGPQERLLAVSLLGPADRLTLERRLAFLEPLRAATHAIEGALGRLAPGPA